MASFAVSLNYTAGEAGPGICCTAARRLFLAAQQFLGLASPATQFKPGCRRSQSQGKQTGRVCFPSTAGPWAGLSSPVPFNFDSRHLTNSQDMGVIRSSLSVVSGSTSNPPKFQGFFSGFSRSLRKPGYIQEAEIDHEGILGGYFWLRVDPNAYL